MAKFRVLGRALQREDGRGKVTGEAHFTADVIRPDMLWAKILRSPLAHARIVSIDTSRARNLPGVKAVITARDVSPKLTGRTLADLPILARERVRFVGDKVAVVGIIDQGAGVHVMQTQVVAEILGIKPERVTVEVPDTNHAPFHDGIKGQGATHVTGQAASRATQALIDSMKARAAIHWEADPAGIEWRDGRVWLRDGKKSLDLKQLASLAPGEPGRGFAYYDGRIRPREHIFQSVIADVEVDKESGQVQVRRLSTFHDVSVVINSLTHQGQIEGGMLQGLGMAVCEEMLIEDAA
jgi:CO/xanthine dehydrogenase Mo-binding subunit